MTSEACHRGTLAEGARRRRLRAGVAASFLALPVSFLAAAAACAQPITCADLAVIVRSAEADFAPIRGPLKSSIMPGENPLRRATSPGTPDSGARSETARDFERRVQSTNFEVRIHATTRPLAGAGSCEIRMTIHDSARFALRDSTYRCEWPSRDAFAALAQSVASCLRSEAIREEAPESLRFYLAQDRSGESVGERSVRVSIDAGTARAATISITKSACRDRSPRGCDAAPRR